MGETEAHARTCYWLNGHAPRCRLRVSKGPGIPNGGLQGPNFPSNLQCLPTKWRKAITALQIWGAQLRRNVSPWSITIMSYKDPENREAIKPLIQMKSDAEVQCVNTRIEELLCLKWERIPEPWRWYDLTPLPPSLPWSHERLPLQHSQETI
jgi:hypothetical protein